VPIQIAAFVGVREQEAGLAAGLINTSQEAGGALGVAALSTVAFTAVAHRLAAAHGNPAVRPLALASGFHRGFFIGALLSALALIIATLLLPRLPVDSDRGARPGGVVDGSPSGPARPSGRLREVRRSAQRDAPGVGYSVATEFLAAITHCQHNDALAVGGDVVKF
jgi:hypothetical protein